MEKFLPWVDLHMHTRFSYKDAIPDPEDYAIEVKKRAEERKCPEMMAFAVTEHGHMQSFAKHYKACEAYGIKAIIGMEAYHCVDRKSSIDERFHFGLLAKTQDGLKNLYKIATDAGMHKIKKSKEFAITEEAIFKKYGKGIIGLTACIGGIIPQLIIHGELEKAKEKILQYKDYFDELYLEVQPHETKEQLLVNDVLVKFSYELGVPLIITDDAHFIDAADKKYHDILEQMNHLEPFQTTNNFKTPEEIYAYCIKYGIPEQAISNTIKVANSCNTNPKPTSNDGLMPNYPCPKGHNEDSYLRELVMNSLVKKIIKKKLKMDKVIYQELYMN